MSLRQKAQRALERALTTAEHLPLADVFYDSSEGLIVVPWRSSQERAVRVEQIEVTDENGEKCLAWTNAEPLPDGRPKHSATYAGSIFKPRDATDEWTFDTTRAALKARSK
jgi:hypothetical protein